MLFFKITLLIGCIVSFGTGSPHINVIHGYFNWVEGHLKDMWCPTSCWTRIENCCACWALPCWELTTRIPQIPCNKNVGDLDIEYIDLRGRSLLSNDDTQANATHYQFIHENARMTVLPNNLCEFGHKLLKLHLSWNLLTDISDISCLVVLDTLHLDHNKIKIVSNQTFTGMQNLRVLSLTYNPEIRALSPNTLDIGNGNIFTVDLSHNHFDRVDITDILRPGLYCKVNYSDGFIQNITNFQNYNIKDHGMHGLGDIYMEHSGMTSFLDITEYGIGFDEMLKYTKGFISIDSSSIMCDCKIYPLFSVYGENVVKFWPQTNISTGNFICTGPEQLKGKDLLKLIRHHDFEALTCNLINCPYGCRCTDIPDLFKVIVNCSDGGLMEFPDEMPIGYNNNSNVDLLLARNRITDLSDRDYLSRLVGLDISGNDITHIEPKALQSISCLLNIKDQRLTTIIEEFQFKDPRSVVFGDHPVRCDCSNLWIGDWIRYFRGHRILNCLVDTDRVLPAERVFGKTLACDIKILPIKEIVIPLAVFSFLISLGLLLGHQFRFESIILSRKLHSRKTDDGDFLYDVFLSFCDSNDDVFRFVWNVRNELSEALFISFVPAFDINGGCNLDDELPKAIEKSHKFVVIVCNEYLRSYNCLNEFGLIWTKFRRDKTSDIIVINFDAFDASEIDDRRLRAFVRVKKMVDFKNTNGSLFDRLKSELGQPTAIRNEPLDGKGKDDEEREEEHLEHDFGQTRAKPVQRNLVFERLSKPVSTCQDRRRKCFETTL